MKESAKNDKVNYMNKVKEFIKEKNLIQNGDHIIIGVSGGADSVYLLLILNELRESMNLTITAVHINHMIRREAVDDQKFVQDLCGQLLIPCKIFEIDVKQIAKREKMSLEEAGRKARYDAFAKTMKKYNADKIAIAHHQNDQAETFLYRVVRGTGIYGAGAMREKDGNLIRPLLCVKKEEIVKYLKEAGQAWVEDASNQDDAFARNQIRNQVIPRFEMINEQAVEHIGWLCEDIKEVTTYLTDQIEDQCRQQCAAEIAEHRFFVDIEIQIKILSVAVHPEIAAGICPVAGVGQNVGRTGLADALHQRAVRGVQSDEARVVCGDHLVVLHDKDGAADVLRVAVQHALDGQGCPLHKLRRGHPVRQQCGVPCCGAAGGNIHRRAIL